MSGCITCCNHARTTGALLALLVVCGCASTHYPAPVTERAPPGAASAAPAASATATDGSGLASDYYTVKKSDTLYSIALEHGLDYKELAAWNGIDNPGVIQVGQQLRVKAPASVAVATPLRTTPPVEGRPVAGGAPLALGSSEAIKSQPKAVKVPYSDLALAQLSAQPQARPAAPTVVKVEPRPEEKSAAGEDDEKVDWGWPAGGKLLSGFNETTNLKGIGIAGKLGQPVIASAPGKVLYSGDGIRGYGKLVIIKHNKVYLSVYAHNSQLLVKEGQSVVKGQKIAEMGASDADQVNLHFEIRRFGKPVDPLKLLPPDRPAQAAL